MKDKFYIEIRSCAGGIEATLFVQEILNMYLKMLKNLNYKYSVVSEQRNDLNGFNEVVLFIEGDISLFLNESGIHKVQRISKTEKREKMHTSTISVAIIPFSSNEKLKINEKDLLITTMKSQGAGGQHVNKTESAVRIIHLPTNIEVVCQSERSQHKNRAIALKILESKLQIIKDNEFNYKLNKIRKEQVKEGNRSDAVRTYNYQRSQITNHLDNKKYSLQKVLNGSIEILIK